MRKSIINYLRQSALVCAFAGPYDIDINDHPYVNATTPDELIAAAMIESFARDFADWKAEIRPTSPVDEYGMSYIYHPRNNHETMSAYLNGRIKEHNNWKYALTLSENRSTVTHALVNQKKKLVLVYRSKGSGCCEFHVNAIPLATHIGVTLINSYTNLCHQIAEAKAVADRAKAQMEAEKKKWDLAENLLGMKRNEFGALVPKETPDTPCVGKVKDKMCYCYKCNAMTYPEELQP